MLIPMDAAWFDEAYNLLCASLPADEYRDYAEQKRLLLDPRYTLYTTSAHNAMMAVWQFEGFLYVEHFAVSAQCREKGVGSDMLKALLGMSAMPVCLEVDPPENEISKRRVAFYERNGFVLNPQAYVQPPLGENKRALPLRMMSAPNVLSKEEYAFVKETLYTQVYQIKFD